MRRLGIILFGILFALAAFWLGLMLNFPGESVSRFISAKVNRAQGFDLVLSPAELRWNKLYIERAELWRRGDRKAGPLFALTDFGIPLTWRLVRGLPAHGAIGANGGVEAFLPWGEGGEAWLEGRVMLEEFPLPKVFQPVELEGELRFSGQFKMNAQSQMGQQLPEGVFHATGSALLLQGVKAANIPLPPTRLDSLKLSLETGRTIDIKSFRFEGDLQGEVRGTLTPNLRIPRNTLLALESTISFRNSWLARLGDFKALMEGMMVRGRLTVRLAGTVGNPRLTQVRGRAR